MGFSGGSDCGDFTAESSLVGTHAEFRGARHAIQAGAYVRLLVRISGDHLDFDVSPRGVRGLLARAQVWAGDADVRPVAESPTQDVVGQPAAGRDYFHIAVS